MADEPAKSSETRAPWPYGGAIPQRFSRNYERYQRRGGLNDVAADAQAFLGGGQAHDIERFFSLSLAFDQIHKEQLEGDFLELGVYKGDTAAVLARQVRRLGRRLWLLDTFGGFDNRDFVGIDGGRTGGFSDTSLEAVQARVGPENTTFVRGYFPDTSLHLPPDNKYCLVHIDTDLYAPILSGLEYFYPRMVPGGFMIIHDYSSLDWPGAERAVDEFFADKPESVILLPDSAGSAIIRRQRPADASSNWFVARQSIQLDRWYPTANGQLNYLLVDGWSVAEEWGIWGVGPSHRIQFKTDAVVDGSLTLECDVNAFVPAHLSDRSVNVVINGKAHSTWHFGPIPNRSARSLTFQPSTGVNTIEFHHNLTVTRADMDPTVPDVRPLGMALHGMKASLGSDAGSA